MIEIKKYTEKYDNDIKRFAPDILKKIKHHKSVLKFSTVVAEEKGKAIGAAFLKKDTLFEHFIAGTLPGELSNEYDGTVYIQAEFSVLSGHPDAVRVTEALIEDLKDTFLEIEEDFPETEIVLRMWCNERNTRATQVLMSLGFYDSGRSYTVMEKTLSRGANSSMLRRYELPPIPLEHRKAFREYIDANADGFGYSDSENEIRFVKEFGKGTFYGTYVGNTLISSVTVWPIKNNGIATENIFCRKAYRKTGYTEALLKKVLDFSAQKGYEYAKLNVLSDNIPAISLYKKLGYKEKYRLCEMHFE